MSLSYSLSPLYEISHCWGWRGSRQSSTGCGLFTNEINEYWETHLNSTMLLGTVAEMLPWMYQDSKILCTKKLLFVTVVKTWVTVSFYNDCCEDRSFTFFWPLYAKFSISVLRFIVATVCHSSPRGSPVYFSPSGALRASPQKPIKSHISSTFVCSELIDNICNNWLPVSLRAFRCHGGHTEFVWGNKIKGLINKINVVNLYVAYLFTIFFKVNFWYKSAG